MNYIYIIECSDKTLYTGWTNDLKKRLEKHNNGTGSKYTRGRTPIKLKHFEEFDSKREAMKREYEIKTWNREKKLKLISESSD